jgi:hypothetical protein
MSAARPPLPRPELALREALSALPPAVAAELGPLAHALLARLRLRGPAPRLGPGAPDGLAGLDRRGPFDRLMHSEWALLDVAPEAFLQRAADAELMFLALHTEAPRPPSGLLVLLDGGPSQLGLPRMGQAAGLMALAARAASEGLRLRWAPLSERGGAPVEGLVPGWIDALRQARRAAPLSPEALGCAIGALEPEERLVWLGPPGRPAGGPADALCLSFVGEGDVLHVKLDDRLLIDWGAPFGGTEALRPAPALPRSGPKAIAHRTWVLPMRPGFFFSPSGARLLGQTTGGAAVALPVEPDAASARRPHLREQSGRLLGLGWIDQRLATLSARPDGSFPVSVGRQVPASAPPAEAQGAAPARLVLPPPDPGGLPLPGQLVTLDGVQGAVLLPQPGLWLRCSASGRPAVPGGWPWGWPAHFEGPDGEPLAAQISFAGALSPLRAPGLQGMPVGVGEERRPYVLGARGGQAVLSGPESAEVVVAGRGVGGGPSGELRLWVACTGRRPRLQVARAAGADAPWRLPSAGLATQPEEQLFGVLVPGNDAPLLLVGAGAALLLRGFGGARPLPVDAHPVVWAAASPRGDAVAWLDAAGTLVVFHLPSASAIATARPQ